MRYNYGQQDEDEELGQLSDNELLNIDDLVDKKPQINNKNQNNKKQSQNEEFEVIGKDEEEDLLKSDEEVPKLKPSPLKSQNNNQVNKITQEKQKSNNNKNDEEEQYEEDYEEEFEEEYDNNSQNHQSNNEDIEEEQIDSVNNDLKQQSPPKISNQQKQTKQIQTQIKQQNQLKQNSPYKYDQRKKSVESQESFKSNSSQNKIINNKKVQISKQQPQINQKVRSNSQQQKPPIGVLQQNNSKQNIKSTNQSFEVEQIYIKKYSSMLVDKNYEKATLQEVLNENNFLRQQFKDLNQEISSKIEHSKIHMLKKKDAQKSKKRPISQQKKTANAEEQNNEQIFQRLQKEYQKLQNRVNQCSDPGYIIDINEKIASLKLQIERLKRDNKLNNISNGKAAKNLDTIENISGQPDSLKQAHDINTELSHLHRKTQKYQQRLEEIQSEFAEIKKKLPISNEKYDKLLILAKHYKIQLEPYGKKQKLKEKYVEVKKKTENLEKYLETLKKSNQVKEDLMRKDLDEIKKEIHQKNQEINLKEAEIFQINNLMRDKMNREQISSRQIREECQKLGIPYTPPERKFDEISITSAPPNKRKINQSLLQQNQSPNEKKGNKSINQKPDFKKKQQNQTLSPPNERIQEEQKQDLKIYDQHDSIEIKDEYREQKALEELKLIQEKEKQQEELLQQQEQQRLKQQEEQNKPKGFSKPTFALKKKQENKDQQTSNQQQLPQQSNNEQIGENLQNKFYQQPQGQNVQQQNPNLNRQESRHWKTTTEESDKQSNIINKDNKQNIVQAKTNNNENELNDQQLKNPQFQANQQQQQNQNQASDYNFSINSRIGRQRGLNKPQEDPNINNSNQQQYQQPLIQQTQQQLPQQNQTIQKPIQQNNINPSYMPTTLGNNNNQQNSNQIVSNNNSNLSNPVQIEQKKNDGYSFDGPRVGRNRGGDNSTQDNIKLQQQQQPIKKNEIYDPFAKFDDIDKLNLNKKLNIQPTNQQQQSSNENQSNNNNNPSNVARIQNNQINKQADNNTNINLNNNQQQSQEQPKLFNFNKNNQKQDENIKQQTNVQKNEFEDIDQNKANNIVKNQQEEDDLFKGPQQRQQKRMQKPQKRDIFNENNNSGVQQDVFNIPTIIQNNSEIGQTNKKEQVQQFQENKQQQSQVQQEEDDGLDFLKENNKPKIKYNDDEDLFGGLNKKKQNPQQNNIEPESYNPISLGGRRKEKQKQQDNKDDYQKKLAQQAEKGNALFDDLDI